MPKKPETKAKPKKMTESDYRKQEKSVSEKLAAQPKVQIYIHQNEGSPPRWEGNLGGVSFLIPKNKWVEVPEDLATMIKLNNTVKMETQRLIKKFEGSGPKIAEFN